MATVPDKKLTPAEISANREALRFVNEWLRFRERNQRWLAEQMGTSEATVSKWLGGTQSMKVAQFTAMARLLSCNPQELLLAPGDTATANQYKELAEIVDNLSTGDLQAYLAIGRSMSAKNK